LIPGGGGDYGKVMVFGEGHKRWAAAVKASTLTVSVSTIVLNLFSMLAMSCSRAPMSANLRIISSLTLSDPFPFAMLYS